MATEEVFMQVLGSINGDGDDIITELACGFLLHVRVDND